METGSATAAADPVAESSSRARVLASYDVFGAMESGEMSDIAAFAAELCEAPVALVTVIDDTYQRFLSAHGTEVAGNARELSFCTYAIERDGVMEVPDATLDPRFADNPLVAGPPHLRFYAGAPMRTPDGFALGTVCVFGLAPRAHGLGKFQRRGLELLAKAAMGRLEAKRMARERGEAHAASAARLAESDLRFRTLADTMPQMVWSTLPDGFHDYYNARWYEFTGVPEGSTDGEGWSGMFHPDDQERAWERWRRSLATGDPYEVEYRLRHRSGEYRWVLGRALPIRDAEGRITRWFGTCTDIHEHKTLLEQREVLAQELSHRIKNIFAVVSGLITLAAKGRPGFGEIAADLRRRITALGRAHDYVRPHSAQSHRDVMPDSLHGLLADLFEPYGRVRVAGEDVRVDDRSATPLSLLFHELATNASKYGALSVPEGEVLLAVACDGDRVRLTWTERGGPEVTEPGDTVGFGSQLVELSAVRQLGGGIRREWDPRGLIVTVEAPRSAFSRR